MGVHWLVVSTKCVSCFPLRFKAKHLLILVISDTLSLARDDHVLSPSLFGACFYCTCLHSGSCFDFCWSSWGTPSSAQSHEGIEHRDDERCRIAGRQNDRPKIFLSRPLVLCLVFDLLHRNRHPANFSDRNVCIMSTESRCHVFPNS